jgi:hypothetical protein
MLGVDSFSYARILSANVCYVFVIKQLWWTEFSLYFPDITGDVFSLFQHPISQNRATQYQPHCNNAGYGTNQIEEAELFRASTMATACERVRSRYNLTQTH